MTGGGRAVRLLHNRRAAACNSADDLGLDGVLALPETIAAPHARDPRGSGGWSPRCRSGADLHGAARAAVRELA